jgi:hypothetical protein
MHRLVSASVYAVIVTLSAASVASAQQRPDTRALPCAGARALVQDYQAVVMTTGPYTYDRIVSGFGLCERGQITEIKMAPTQDNPSCHVGYVCKEKIVDKNF